MQKVRAKFRCVSVTDYGHQKQVHATAVSGIEGENADYSRYTPSGELKITIDQGTVATEFFTPGKPFYMTFEDAPDDRPKAGNGEV
jgi:hypothetical protein